MKKLIALAALLFATAASYAQMPANQVPRSAVKPVAEHQMHKHHRGHHHHHHHHRHHGHHGDKR